jgi:hypothetical protein
MISIQNKIESARARANSDGMAALERLQDDQRFVFLDKLHVAAQGQEVQHEGVKAIVPARVRLARWEQGFVADLVRENRPLTFAQRRVVDELRQRHQSRLC